jgi:hypothetical protein
VYCPECRVEYREGSTECADCRVPLLAGTPPPEPESTFNPDMELVVVLDTCDSLALGLAKGLLEEAGIPFFVLNEVSRLVNDIDPMLRKWVRVQVASDREAEAREILASISQPEAGGVDTHES